MEETGLLIIIIVIVLGTIPSIVTDFITIVTSDIIGSFGAITGNMSHLITVVTFHLVLRARTVTS